MCPTWLEVGRVAGDDKAAPLVLYCNGPYCGKAVRLSLELAEAAAKEAFHNVAFFDGPWEELGRPDGSG